MAPLMTLSLKQGFGRLIRRSDDCGVVAILDERLTSKAYGRRTRQDLPPARFTRDLKDVHRFYGAALGVTAEFALNVWAADARRWRWQLVRLLDGRADTGSGRGDSDDAALLELTAALDGLRDLHERIRRAGHEASRYAVELRCSQATADAIAAGIAHTGLAQRWAESAGAWQSITPLPVRR